MRRRGYSLLEVVIALFLLGTSTLFVVNIFHVALQRSRSSEAQTTARLLVEQKWSELRAWAADNYIEEASLSSIDGEVTQSAEHSGFEVKVSATPWILHSPSKEFEMARAEEERRTIEDCVASVEVTATWSGAQGKGAYTLTGLLPAAYRAVDTIDVKILGSAVVGQDGTTELEAVALDAEGNPVKGVSFGWWVSPSTGNGTITPRVPNNIADLQHRVTLLDGTIRHSDGLVKVGVATRTGDKVVSNEDTEVTFVP
jgi:Tfp pilus assembly protein PilE